MAHDEVQLESLKSDMRLSSKADFVSIRNSSDVDVQSEVNQVNANVTPSAVVHYRLYKRRFMGLLGFVSVLLQVHLIHSC